MRGRAGNWFVPSFCVVKAHVNSKCHLPDVACEKVRYCHFFCLSYSLLYLLEFVFPIDYIFDILDSK